MKSQKINTEFFNSENWKRDKKIYLRYLHVRQIAEKFYNWYLRLQKPMLKYEEEPYLKQ